jgi:hypothetical protein
VLIQYGNQVNGSVEENIFSSGGSSTTSGNIEQAMISQSTATLPLNRNRASAYAPMMPNSSVRMVVVPATMIELMSERPKLFAGENTASKFSSDAGLGMNSVLRPSVGIRSEDTIIQ